MIAPRDEGPSRHHSGPNGKQHQVSEHVCRIRVANGQRPSSHPPDPDRINEQPDTEGRTQDVVSDAARFHTEEYEARTRIEVERLREVGDRENDEQNGEHREYSTA